MEQGHVLKVASSATLGAGTGALVALQLGYLWWLGLIVGFLVGYLCFEYETMWEACRQVVRRCHAPRPPINLRARAKAIGWACIPAFTICLYMGGIISGLIWYFKVPNQPTFLSIAQSWFTGGFLGIASFNSFLYPDPEEGLRQMREAAMEQNPITHLIWIAGALPRLVRWLYQVAGEVCRLIWSDLRLLSGTSAALGALVGYLLGNALLGALTGGCLGAVGYTLLARRWPYGEPN